MKVLEKGREQRGWAAEYHCTGKGNGDGGCNAKLLVEEGDLFLTESHARDETSRYLTFCCPDCKVLTDIDDDMHYKINRKIWEGAPLKDQHPLFKPED